MRQGKRCSRLDSWGTPLTLITLRTYDVATGNEEDDDDDEPQLEVEVEIRIFWRCRTVAAIN